VLYAVAVVSIAHSLLSTTFPLRTAGTVARAPAAAAVGSDLAGAGYAVSFARAYLSYDGADPAARTAALAPFVGSGGSVGADGGFTAPSSGSQTVGFAQVVGEQSEAGGPVVYTVQADTSRLGTVYLAVTVAHAADALELVGGPALVGAPVSAPAVAAAQAAVPVSDPALAKVVSGAIVSYLRGDSSALRADLSPGTAVVSLPSVSLNAVQVTRIAWQQPGHVVGVDVEASDAVGGGYALHYDVGVVRRGGWLVSGIESLSSSGG
jgi:hypothetical protein